MGEERISLGSFSDSLEAKWQSLKRSACTSNPMPTCCQSMSSGEGIEKEKQPKYLKPATKSMRISPRPQWSFLAPEQEDDQVASLWNLELLKEWLVGNAFPFFHSFIEVSLTYNNLHIFSVTV